MLFFNAKKKHYKAKIKITQEKIWDHEFMRVQLKEMREGFRREYDRIKEMVTGYEIRKDGLEKAKANKDPKDERNYDEEIAQAQNQILALTNDLKQLEEQMDGVDNQTKQTEQSIDGYRQVIGMLDTFIKNL